MSASVARTWPLESFRLVYGKHGEPSEVLGLEKCSISPPGDGEVLLDVLAVIAPSSLCLTLDSFLLYYGKYFDHVMTQTALMQNCHLFIA